MICALDLIPSHSVGRTGARPPRIAVLAAGTGIDRHEQSKGITTNLHKSRSRLPWRCRVERYDPCLKYDMVLSLTTNAAS
jgi:hypothetical protein